MKLTSLIIFLIFLFSINISADCESDPTIEMTGKILKELTVGKNRSPAAAESAESAELGLFVKASAKGASWQKAGAEAAVITVFVNGKYNQDAVLFAGETSFEYQMLLGKFSAAGKHRITIVLNVNRSAPNARNVKIHSAFANYFEDLTATRPFERSIPAYIATVNAPVIYLRPDTIDKFSDIPLLTYYEIFDEPEDIKRIRYTTIFTNEDGGTQSAALMARWGRMTDIEWIYEIRVKVTGEILSEIYQAANHETRNFRGRRLGSHPLVLDATVNNNFSDAGCSLVRVSPLLIKMNLADGSRETVMDANPWTYRLMAEEAARENRVNPQQLGADAIDDLRNYLYVEIFSENDSAGVAVEAEAADGVISRSDSGDARLRVNRSGFQRIAVRQPSPTSPVKSLSIVCRATSDDRNSSACRNARIVKYLWLDGKYRLISTPNIKNEARSLKPDEKLTWSPAN